MTDNASRLTRARILIAARKGIGDPALIKQAKERDYLVAMVVGKARQRRFAMKVQQKLDRSLESYVRREYTKWSPDLPEAERNKINASVKQIIKAVGDGQGPEDLMLLVAETNKSRSVWDELKKKEEKQLEGLAAQLPAANWIKTIPGAGLLGLALIVAEAGATDENGNLVGLDNYANPAKLRKRLGFAPYDGHAGSTWKRESWRPRSLDKQEWINNPFSGERYSVIYTIADALFKKQWMSAKKAGGDEGKPNGRYGEVYYARRQHTQITHPEWTDGHRYKDALRRMMQTFLDDLWEHWIDQASGIGQVSVDAQTPNAKSAGAPPTSLGPDDHDAHCGPAETVDGHSRFDAHFVNAADPNNLGHRSHDAQLFSAEIAADHSSHDAHVEVVSGKQSRNLGPDQRDAQWFVAEIAAGDQREGDARRSLVTSGPMRRKQGR